jgi:hypothetical protein
MSGCGQRSPGVVGNNRTATFVRLRARDYRVEDFEDLLVDRSTFGDAFGASGLCQCLLTILIIVSAGFGAFFGGNIATGVTVVLSAAGSMWETCN